MQIDLARNTKSCQLLFPAPPIYDRKVIRCAKLQHSPGKSQAEATFDMVEIWNVESAITSLVFDTTASNREWKSGAVRLLENLFQKKLFHCACRQNIYELVVSAAWNCLFGNATTRPYNPYFVTIKSIWTDIDHRKPTKEFFILDPSLLRLKFQVISELKEKLSKATETNSVIARGDYKHCAENTLVLLGE